MKFKQALLADPTISMVIVLNPAPSHYGLIKQALLAGKHVYTEKTMTHELGLARELVQVESTCQRPEPTSLSMHICGRLCPEFSPA